MTLFVLAAFLIVQAEDPGPAISTDRPSFSDSTSIVPPLRLQLEAGYTFTYRHDDARTLDRHEFPDTILRFGLLEDRLELRALWGGWSWLDSDVGDRDVNGSNDVTMGIKLKLTDQTDGLPRVLLVAQSTIGVGDKAFSTRHADPTFKLAWSYDLGGGFGLGGNAILSLPSDDRGHFSQGQGSIYVTWSVEPETTFFVEYFMIHPVTRDGGPAHSMDAGVLHLFSRRVQGDVRVGFGLNERADDFFVGAGIAVLF
jgi:hypothetical protein